MTNKVKPFYVKITDDMTPQMVQDAFDKCVDAGVNAEECIANTNRRHSYQDVYDAYFNCFGVDDDNITVLYDNHENYGIDAQEITLDQLDGWLGITGGSPKREWKNGDKCEHGHHDYSGANKMTYIGAHPFISEKHVCLSELKGLVIVDSAWLRKPETPEQKAERERQYAVYDMCSDLDNHADDAKFWCERLYDLGYRKQ